MLYCIPQLKFPVQSKYVFLFQMQNKKCIRFNVTIKPKPIDKTLKNGYHPYVNDYDGTYIGEWKDDQRHGFGALYNKKNHLIYDGQWRNNVLNGQGSIRKKIQDGRVVRIYIGQFLNNMKHGEGKKMYRNGVYFGYWRENKRNGIGIHWYNDNSFYMGEWCNDMYNGAGILRQRNGNRYEGFWKDNLKHDEGTFYHNHTGQLQKGIWVNDFCKTSIMQDAFRQHVDIPTEYPIKYLLQLSDPDDMIHRTFRGFMERSVFDLRQLLRTKSDVS